MRSETFSLSPAKLRELGALCMRCKQRVIGSAMRITPDSTTPIGYRVEHKYKCPTPRGPIPKSFVFEQQAMREKHGRRAHYGTGLDDMTHEELVDYLHAREKMGVLTEREEIMLSAMREKENNDAGMA